MANERHVDHREWEIDASTRTSGHPFTKYSPFRTATSTTAATLFTVPTQVVATNWIENPGVEGTGAIGTIIRGGWTSIDVSQTPNWIDIDVAA